MKRIISILIILIVSFNIVSFADDKIEEESSKEVKEVIQTAAEVSKKPSINSRQAVVMDRNSKSILYGKNENVKTKMASTTKIMTAMVVLQNTNLENTVEVSKKAALTGGSRLGLKEGDKITVRDLLYGLLLRSGNDAAVALAEYVGGSIEGFAKLMNENTIGLGLKNTHFVTPHGLDQEEHYTTAYELAIIADYALKNKTFAQIVNTKNCTIHINNYAKNLNNTNELLGNLNGVYGVKTGFTNGAGRCLVTSIKRENLDVICVVLGADTKKDRTKDSVKLIEYVFGNYKTINLTKDIEEDFEKWNQINKNRIYIEKGKNNNLNLALEKKEYTYPIENNTEDKIKMEIQANLNLKAPVKKGTKIGELTIYYKGEIINKINIVNLNEVNKKRIENYILDFASNYDNYLEKIFEIK